MVTVNIGQCSLLTPRSPTNGATRGQQTSPKATETMRRWPPGNLAP